MRLRLRLLGRELLAVDLNGGEPEIGSEPRLEATGGGQFELANFGFEIAEQIRRCPTAKS